MEQFELIRQWAEQRGLYEKGDVKTQFVKSGTCPYTFTSTNESFICSKHPMKYLLSNSSRVNLIN